MTNGGRLEALQVITHGRGRALENVFCERKKRSVKFEIIYLKRYGTVRHLQDGLIRDFDFYNHERLH